MAWDDISQYSWLHPRRSPAENLALGAQTGATIRSAWTQRHADTRAAQMLPYQMYAAEQQARSDAYQVKVAMKKLEEEDALNAGLAELSEIDAEAAKNGTWDTPEHQVKLRRLGIRYPKMTITQPYLSSLGQAATARKERMALLKDLADIEATVALAEERRTGRFALEDLRQINRIALEKERTARANTLEDLRQKNRIALESLRQSALTSRSTGTTRAQWQSRVVNSVMNNFGYELDEATRIAGEVWDESVAPGMPTPQQSITPQSQTPQAPAVNPDDPAGLFTPRP